MIEDAERSGSKLKNYDVAKQVELEVKQQNTDSEQWDRAYESRVVSVAVSCKKKVASDAISNVVKRLFP